MTPLASEFHPNWASAPGDTITDILGERKLSIVEFAQRTGMTLTTANDLLQGRSTITIGMAQQLQEFLGGSVEFWMSRDFQYREDVSRAHLASEQWLKELPLSDMIKFGWIIPTPRPAEEVAACLRFFGVASIEAWQAAYHDITALAAFRTSASFDSQPAAVAAWLRQAEIEAESAHCATWNAPRLKGSLDAIRRLTMEKDPKVFIPALKQICSSCGVACLVIRAPSGCRASGATRFISPQKALLLLSFRYLSDDQFWFTFFHEVGHLLLHGEDRMFVEGLEPDTSRVETEANDFAEAILIPVEFRDAMLGVPLETRSILRVARQIGVSPGILVGQLQHHGRVRLSHFNGLKRRFEWHKR